MKEKSEMSTAMMTGGKMMQKKTRMPQRLKRDDSPQSRNTKGKIEEMGEQATL